MEVLDGQRAVKSLPKRRRQSDEVSYTPGAASNVHASDLAFKFDDLYAELRGDIGDAETVDEANSNTNGESSSTEAEYVDHLQQPGNKKKRKVPLAPPAFGGVEASSVGQPAMDEFQDSRTYSTENSEEQFQNAIKTVHVTSPAEPLRRRYSRATATALRRKMLLNTRRRQVSAVLENINTRNSIAIDQALGGDLGWYRPASATLAIRAHSLNHRGSHRFPPISVEHRETSHTVKRFAPANTSFGFEIMNASSERFIATRLESTILKSRFQTELGRQAAAANEAAQKASLSLPSDTRKSKESRSFESRARGAPVSAQAHSDGTSPAPTKPTSKKKKKKRSALANASNPHHLRNYVPSRLPSSAPPATITAAQAALTFLGPPPFRLLTADKLTSKYANPSVAASKAHSRKLTSEESMLVPDEWICPECEYDLFYGLGSSMRRAVENRKKILRRRRRARARAARAASGVAPAFGGTAAAEDDLETEGEADYEEEAADQRFVSQDVKQEHRATGTKTHRNSGADDGAG